MDPNCWTLIRKYLDLGMKIRLEPLRWRKLKKLSFLWKKQPLGLIKYPLNSINIVGTLKSTPVAVVRTVSLSH